MKHGLPLLKRALPAVERIGILADRAMGVPSRKPALRTEGPPRNILWWSMDRIGDVARSTAALRVLAGRFTTARVTAVVAGRSAPVLEANPHIAALHVVSRSHAVWDHLRVLRQLRATPWDLGFIATAEPAWRVVGEWTMRLLGVPSWAAFSFRTSRLPHRPWCVPLDERGSWVDQFLRLVATVGVTDDGQGTELFVTDAERRWAEQFLESAGVPRGEPYFVVAPGGSFLTVSRQWPPAAYARLLCLMRSRWPYPILVTGVGSEREIVEAIRAQSDVQVINLCGRLTLRQLIAVLAGNAISIMNDSGPFHLASGLRTPAVVILGPTAPWVVGIPATARAVRADLPCSPCAFLQGWQHCTNEAKWQCLSTIQPEAVLEAVKSQVEKTWMRDAVPDRGAVIR
ncbi:MAG: glycosyltransferase family 9 protein [Planctomycetota bacterium]